MRLAAAPRHPRVVPVSNFASGMVNAVASSRKLANVIASSVTKEMNSWFRLWNSARPNASAGSPWGAFPEL